MKLPQIVVLLIIATVTVTQLKAQITLQAGGGLGISKPLSDFSGSTVEYYSGTNYGLSSGLNLHGKVRVGLLGLLLAGEINYSSFSNEGNAFSDGRGKVDISQKVISIRVGPEFKLPIPALPLEPYVGVNLAYNSISGTTEFQGIQDVPSGSYNVSSATRFGLGLNGGLIYSINPLMDLDLNITYNMLNLLGKSFDTAGDKRIESYQGLNDEKDPDLSTDTKAHFISNDRSISSLEIRATVMFGL